MKKIFNFRCEDHLMEKFQLFAELEGRSYSEIMRSMLIAFIDDSSKKHQKDIEDLRKEKKNG